MEKSKKTEVLNTFLLKVKRLRGFGDMDSYRLVNQFKAVEETEEETKTFEIIIDEFSSPQKWAKGKENFTRRIEAQIRKLETV